MPCPSIIRKTVMLRQRLSLSREVRSNSKQGNKFPYLHCEICYIVFARFTGVGMIATVPYVSHPLHFSPLWYIVHCCVFQQVVEFRYASSFGVLNRRLMPITQKLQMMF